MAKSKFKFKKWSVEIEYFQEPMAHELEVYAACKEDAEEIAEMIFIDGDDGQSTIQKRTAKEIK